MPDPDIASILDEAEIFLAGGKFEDARAAVHDGLKRFQGEPALLDMAVKIREAQTLAASKEGIPAPRNPAVSIRPSGKKPNRFPLYAGSAATAGLLALVLHCVRANPEKEVRAAFDSYQRALQSQDIRALRQAMTRAKGAEMELAAESHDGAAAMILALNPKNVKILALKAEQDKARLTVQGEFDSVQAPGWVGLLKEDGTWKVEEVHWSATFDGEKYVASVPEAGAAPTEVLSGSAPATEDMTASGPEATPSPTVDYSTLSPKDAAARSDAELLTALRQSRQPGILYDELAKRGKQAEALAVLQERLRDKADPGGESPEAVVDILEKAGQPVLFAWRKSPSPKKEPEGIELLEWEIEVKGRALYTSGQLYLGQGLIDGYTRRANPGTMPLIPGSSLELTLSRDGLDLIKKTLKAKDVAGVNSWNNVLIYDGLGPGTYLVRPFLHAQYTGADGVPKSLNFGESTLKVVIR